VSAAVSVSLVLIIGVSFTAAAAADHKDNHLRILILFSDDSNLPAQEIVEQSIHSTLRNGSTAPIEIYSEYLDSVRTSVAGYEEEFVSLLHRKYEDRQIDLIISVSNPALKLLLTNRSKLFPETPIVFYLLDQRSLVGQSLGQNITGVWSALNFKANLDLALELHPNTKNLVVLAGVSDFDKYWTARVREDFPAYEGKLQISYLVGLTIPEQQQALAKLSPETILLFVSSMRDGAGYSNPNTEILRQISPVSKAPIYGTTDAQLGVGIVGGKLISFEAIGGEIGKLGLRILSGEKPESIAPYGIPNVVMFDWRQLQRWNINEQKLPVGSIVRYRQPTIWEQYRWQIIGAISLIILQTFLIALLLVNRAKRRRAEEEVRLSEARFREMADSSPIMIWIADSKMLCTYFNERCMDYTGLTLAELQGNGWLESVHSEDSQRCIDIYTEAYARRESFVYEFRVRRSDGEYRWLYSTGVPRFAANGELLGYIGSAVDIHDRKLAEYAVRESEARFRDMADSSAILIWMADENMFFSYFNKRILDFTGRNLNHLIGDGWLDVVHDDDRQACVDTYTLGYERKQEFILEYRLLGADGKYHWIYDTGTPRIAPNGELLGYIGSAVDISDRRNAEEALQLAHHEVNKLKNQLEAENVYLQEEIKLAHNVDEIIGQSDPIKYVLYKIEQVSHSDTTALILGETGTGKELVARAIHNQSGRRDRPLVKVNCAALSASLIESELFGHEKGAFTGASVRKIGRFELADGATLFLDEIGELPLELQPKLLRVVQEGEFERLGGTKTIKVNVRILAATNRILKDEVSKGTFREDLWYRLNVFPLTVPPLRQRKEDIPLMVEHFVRGYSRKVGKTITSISATTLKKLTDYSWPGNVRELANVIERAVVNAKGPTLHIADPFEQPRSEREPDLTQTLDEVEKDYIIRVLDSTSWRIGGTNGAAAILGLNPSTLRTRMIKLGIQKSVKTAHAASVRD
jgi:PAS domain S-box-containing protein